MAEALRLADELDQYLYSVPAHPLCTNAAAELRRLHQINSDLCRKTNAQTIQSAREAEKIAVIEAQRDALLEELKLARRYISVHTMDGYHAEMRADAAIKAVEGEMP